MALVCPACRHRFNPFAVRYRMVCRGCRQAVSVAMRYESFAATLAAAFGFVAAACVAGALITVAFAPSGTLEILECVALIAAAEALLWALFLDWSMRVSPRTDEPEPAPRRARRARRR